MMVESNRINTANMKNISRLLFVALLIVGVAIPGKAHVYVGDGEPTRGTRDLKQTTAGCSPSSAFEWLNINNVRTRYNAGGDMWWDLPGGIGAQYFIPANGSATSLFAGALWIAGVDVNNQLKCAAVRFRQGPNVTGGGNDFWTGPLTLDGANIDAGTCAVWDRIWKITRAEVDEFRLQFNDEGQYDPAEDYVLPKVISEWPAHPEAVGGTYDKVSHYMAPFFDVDGDGEYNPMAGDYPYYDIENELCHTKIPTMEEEFFGTVKGSILADQVLKGDMTLWWVFNDKGNTHTESEGSAIGLEIRAQAFGFATNDEINNMSFCSYEIINRSTYELTGTYFCPWTDVDLGYAKDDYVGCDVQRGLGYGYNGNAIDGSGEPEAYGDQPPAVGVDFFQGPYMDPDGLDNPKFTYVVNVTFLNIDPVTGDSVFQYDTLTHMTQQLCDESINGVNFQNGIVDDERFGMRRFLYHNNDNSNTGDPKYAADYYNLLRGIWKDGNRMLYGGNAHPSVAGTVGPACDFMFPGDSDPCNWGTGGETPGGGYNANGKYWTDAEAGNSPADRRFMQSAGPFTLKPGAVNYITFGVPWARATSGGPQASVELLRVTDDKCQALFENCFKVIDGPSAPDLVIRELDQKLIIYLTNSPVSNNYKEGYNEFDPEIPEVVEGDTIRDRNYRFEGYKVYQLFDDQVGADELDDNSKARLVFQCDIKNGVSNLVNYELNEHIGAIVPELVVEGGDGGITHSFVITEDKFAVGDNPALINHKPYYYMAVAYAYNNYMEYSQDPSIELGLYGQKKPYLEGRKNITCYTAVPHKTLDGMVLRCEYGQKVGVTRIVGQGNGGNQLELTQESIDEIFTKKLANTYDDEGNQIVLGHPDYPIIYHPEYKVGYGPLNVKVIDPLNVVTTDYELWFDTLFESKTTNVTTNQLIHIETEPGSNNWVIGSEATRMASHWYLKDLNSDEDPVRSDTITTYTDEKMFIDKGISITITQPYEVGPVFVGSIWDNDNNPPSYDPYKQVLADNSGLITTSFTFGDSTNKWLDGIRDLDVPGSELNWIRSGSYYDYENKANSDFDMASSTYPQLSYDPNEAFEKIANRTWAPACLCAQKDKSVYPVLEKQVLAYEAYQLSRIGSIDIVLTADKSKWTRCPVVEMCVDEKLSQNGTEQFALRKAASVDKDGNPYMVDGELFSDWKNATDSIYISDNPDDPNFISPQGMGWFPGYAIDIESGVRLNFIFSEDSYLEDLNGSDMLFNPPALRKVTVEGTSSQSLDPALFRQFDGEPVFGGKHYVYILGLDKPNKGSGVNDIPTTSPLGAEYFACPGYDAGKYAFTLLHHCQNDPRYGKVLRKYLWRQVLYIGMPMAVEGSEWLPANNDAKISIRVSKPYARGYAALELDTIYKNHPVFEDLEINDMYPVYRFSIDGLDPIPADPAKMESDLDLITVVPNPYYAYSTYEANALNNLVRITNLPSKCIVTIYNLSGTKIRQFKKDNDISYIDWDLTNYANTPVASGFYLIHVAQQDANGNITAERTVKFFGAMRLIDLNTF